MTTPRIKATQAQTAEAERKQGWLLAHAALIKLGYSPLSQPHEPVQLGIEDWTKLLGKLEHAAAWTAQEDIDAPYYELQASDVRHNTIRAWGRTWYVSTFIGSILGPDKTTGHPGDVGKRVYRHVMPSGHGWYLKVESDPEFYDRMHRENKQFDVANGRWEPRS